MPCLGGGNQRLACNRGRISCCWCKGVIGPGFLQYYGQFIRGQQKEAQQFTTKSFGIMAAEIFTLSSCVQSPYVPMVMPIGSRQAKFLEQGLFVCRLNCAKTGSNGSCRGQ